MHKSWERERARLERGKNKGTYADFVRRAAQDAEYARTGFQKPQWAIDRDQIEASQDAERARRLTSG